MSSTITMGAARGTSARCRPITDNASTAKGSIPFSVPSSRKTPRGLLLE